MIENYFQKSQGLPVKVKIRRKNLNPWGMDLAGEAALYDMASLNQLP